MPIWMLLWAGALLFLLNAWTVLRFWQDKQQAIAGTRRVPEADLLLLALLGGTPGAFLARRWFRHKTRKQPFSNTLLVILFIQIGLATGFIIG